MNSQQTRKLYTKEIMGIERRRDAARWRSPDENRGENFGPLELKQIITDTVSAVIFTLVGHH
jgi:hypothetical protein